MVKEISNLNIKTKIILSLHIIFKLWREFRGKHSLGALINSDILVRLNQVKNFKVIMNYNWHVSSSTIWAFYR
jgi:hypothetical protein